MTRAIPGAGPVKRMSELPLVVFDECPFGCANPLKRHFVVIAADELQLSKYTLVAVEKFDECLFGLAECLLDDGVNYSELDRYGLAVRIPCDEPFAKVESTEVFQDGSVLTVVREFEHQPIAASSNRRPGNLRPVRSAFT